MTYLGEIYSGVGEIPHLRWSGLGCFISLQGTLLDDDGEEAEGHGQIRLESRDMFNNGNEWEARGGFSKCVCVCQGISAT